MRASSSPLLSESLSMLALDSSYKVSTFPNLGEGKSDSCSKPRITLVSSNRELSS
jgi:hypothetical protein